MLSAAQAPPPRVVPHAGTELRGRAGPVLCGGEGVRALEPPAVPGRGPPFAPRCPSGNGFTRAKRRQLSLRPFPSAVTDAVLRYVLCLLHTRLGLWQLIVSGPPGSLPLFRHRYCCHDLLPGARGTAVL